MQSLLSLYSASDLLLAPSRLESFGIVAQEAASCNLPSVVFSETGFEDTISHMKSGYIARNNDIEDFKNGVKWCLDSHNYDTTSITKASKEIMALPKTSSSTQNIVEILEEDESYNIYIEKNKEVLPWKTFNKRS